MNIDLLLLFIFSGFILLLMLINKKKVKLEKLLFPVLYMIMYKTKIGLNFMDRVAKKYPKALKIIGFVGIGIGFFGMSAMFYLLARSAYYILVTPAAPAGVALFLPGMKIPGLGYVSFWHWIIAIFLLVIVHEGSHGIIARLYKIKVKSSGFAVFSFFLPIIPLAFVEPDEKQLEKKSKRAQLSVLAAGSFSNIILTVIVGVILFLLINPFAASMVKTSGVQIAGLEKDYPMEVAGVKEGEVILGANNIPINNTDDFIDVLKDVKPGQEVKIETNESNYTITATKNPKNESKGYLGVYITPHKIEYKKGIFVKPLFWLRSAISWIFFANLFVALFNLLPLGPVDGGRMFYLALLHFTKNKKKSKKIWSFVSILCLLLILINFLPTIMKGLKFLFQPFL